MYTRTLAGLAGIWLCCCATSGATEVFLLSNGGRVEGKLLNPDQSPRESYVIRSLEGVQVTLAQGQVKQVISQTAALRHYDQLLPRMPQTADGHWKMAQWCGSHGLTDRRQFHLEQVLQHEPQHKEARHALGYSQVDGRWVKTEQWMRDQGYVRHQGRWRLPQDVALGDVQEDGTQQQVQWRRKLKMWRSWIVKRRGKEQEAVEAIREIRDARAAEPLIDLLEQEDEPRLLKLLYIEALGRLPGQPGTKVFIQRALEDDDPRVRDRCLDELVRQSSPQATAAFIRELGHKDNRRVNRAATGLMRLKDPGATLPLIEALTTRHKYVVSGGGGIGAAFGSGAPGGLSAGGGPKMVEQELRNEKVLAALSALYPGIRYGYDKEGWKTWYIRQHTPETVNLRRDR